MIVLADTSPLNHLIQIRPIYAILDADLLTARSLDLTPPLACLFIIS